MSLTTNIKNPSSRIDIAALCAGLILILSGSAAALAQHSAGDDTGARVEMGQRSVSQKRDAEKALDQFAATLEDLYRVVSEIPLAERTPGEKSRLSLSYFVSIKPNGAARFSGGHTSSKNRLEWSGRYREPLMRLYDAFLPRTEEWNDELLVEFEVGPDDVSLEASIVIDPASRDFLAGLGQSALSQKAARSDYIRSQIFGASQVSVQKNKVIIVTNLPRAGLESLLTKKDK